MTTTPEPPPEAVLIAGMRERPPRQSIRAAATAAGISEGRWRQIEHGVRRFRGTAYPERGPAPTIAKMARAVGAVPEQLAAAGRPDAAAELEALLTVAGPHLTKRQSDALRKLTGKDDPPGKGDPYYISFRSW